jgi:hypothetical protein
METARLEIALARSSQQTLKAGTLASSVVLCIAVHNGLRPGQPCLAGRGEFQNVAGPSGGVIKQLDANLGVGANWTENDSNFPVVYFQQFCSSKFQGMAPRKHDILQVWVPHIGEIKLDEIRHVNGRHPQIAHDRRFARLPTGSWTVEPERSMSFEASRKIDPSISGFLLTVRIAAPGTKRKTALVLPSVEG